MKKVLFAIFLSLVSLTGCSSHSHRTETETVTTPSGEEHLVRKETVIEEHDDDEEGSGILGGTVEVLGDIIAFPFRLVGGLFDLIF